jgi:hypothetical protein
MFSEKNLILNLKECSCLRTNESHTRPYFTDAARATKLGGNLTVVKRACTGRPAITGVNSPAQALVSDIVRKADGR